MQAKLALTRLNKLFYLLPVQYYAKFITQFFTNVPDPWSFYTAGLWFRIQNPNPALFFNGLQDANIHCFSSEYFLFTHRRYTIFSFVKSQHCKMKVFPNSFLLFMEGSGFVQIKLGSDHREAQKLSDPAMEVTEIILVKIYRFCQLLSHSRGFFVRV